jgi:uncharacterized membrane protein
MYDNICRINRFAVYSRGETLPFAKIAHIISEVLFMYKNSKLLSVLSYFFWVGWIIALLTREKDDTLVRRHLNQALVLNIVETLIGYVQRMGGLLRAASGIVGFACFVLFIMGIVRAVKLSEEPLPLIGELELIQ